MTSSQRCLIALLCATLAPLTYCVPKGVTTPHPPPKERFWEPLAAGCKTTPTTVECPKPLFVETLQDGARAISAGRKCCQSLEAEEARAEVRDAVHRGQIHQKNQRINWLEMERWIWGVAGAAIAATVVGLGIGLAP